MRTKILWAFAIVLFLFFNKTASAQAPTISYTSSSNTFTVGTGIGTISPTVGGGSVPSSPAYAAVTTRTTSGASLSGPEGLVIDATHTYAYSVNESNYTIIKTNLSTGVAAIIAGIAGTSGSSDNTTGTSATFSNPRDIAYDGTYLYVCDYTNNKIRRISTTAPYAVTTFAGSGTAAETDGTGTAAAFNFPRGITYDTATASLYVCDYTGGTVRKITVPGAVVTTIATVPSAGYITSDGTNFYITTVNAATTGSTIIKMGPSPSYIVSTFAGSGGTNAEADGTGTGANFNTPVNIIYDNLTNCLYVSDYNANTIRKITVPGAVVTTLAGSGSGTETDATGTAAAFNGPFGITSANNGSLYITDRGGNTIRKINIIGYTISPALPSGLNFDTSTGIITGTPSATSWAKTYTVTATNSSGSASTTISIQVNAATPSSIYYSPSTNIYTVGTAISALTPVNTGCVPATSPGYGYVSTVMASSPNTFNPVYDGAGNLWVPDYTNGQIKKINISSGTVVATVGVTGSTEVDGNGLTTAQFNQPVGIAYDGTGYLYVADMSGEVIRKVSTTSPYTATTVAGNGTNAERDGSGFTSATGAEFSSPRSVVYNAASNCLYVLDVSGGANSGTLRKVDMNTSPATVSTLATSLKYAYSLAYDGANFYVTTYTTGNTVLKISGASPYTVSVFAGSGSSAEADGTGTAASLNGPAGIYYDKSGYLYVTDYTGTTLRKISISGAVVTTVAGKSSTTGETNGLATAARFTTPCGIAGDNSNNLYIIDQTAQTVRAVTLVGYTISPALVAGLSINAGTGVISGTPTATSSPTAYTVTDYCSSGSSSSTTLTIGTGKIYDWTAPLFGGSTAWTNSLNWSPNGVPGASDNARIGVNLLDVYAYQPTVSTNISVCSITFGLGAVAILPPVLTVNGTLTINNALTVTPSLLGLFSSTIQGTGKLNIAPGAPVTLGAYTNLILNSPLTFTLQSTANGDASIAAIPSTSSISGSISVQRYLSSSRGYRLLSSPVYYGSVTSGTNTFNRYSINYLKDSTFMQGTTGASGGFNRTGNPTLYIYRESIVPQFTAFTNSDFRGINNITASPSYSLDLDGSGWSIPVTNGYLFFFIGGLSTTTPWVSIPSTIPATLTTTGTINTGQITSTHWYTPGTTGLSYTASLAPTAQPGTNLMGNPYPSPINWDTYQTSSTTSGIYGLNVDSTIWVLDPITQNYGAYIAGFGGVGSANYATNIIASGQGFFVHAKTTGAQMIFNESAKTAISNPSTKSVMDIPQGRNASNTLMDAPADAIQTDSNPPMQYLRMQIGQTGNPSYEQTMVHFANGTSFAYKPSKDALYKSGYGTINIATYGSNKANLSIQTIPYPGQKNDTVKLVVYAANDGVYQLTLPNLVNVPPLYDIWLKDAYKNDSLDIRHDPSYSFNIYKADANSYGNQRFSLIIRQNPAYAYRLLSFTASQIISSNQVTVNWQTINEGTGMNFTVQRSTDGGKTFMDIGSTQSTDIRSYSMIDKSPVNGLNMYRLQQTDANNVITYSDAVSVRFFGSTQKNGNIVVVYPNPGKDLVNVNINPPTPYTAYTIKFIDSQGIVQKEFTASQPTWSGDISSMDIGFYIIQVTDNSGLYLIGQTKFIKQ